MAFFPDEFILLVTRRWIARPPPARSDLAEISGWQNALKALLVLAAGMSIAARSDQDSSPSTSVANRAPLWSLQRQALTVSA